MARSWVRLFAGTTLTLSLTGHALADEGKITVFAAASLTNAMQDIAAVYKKEKNYKQRNLTSREMSGISPLQRIPIHFRFSPLSISRWIWIATYAVSSSEIR